jgi:beta-glucosidase
VELRLDGDVVLAGPAPRPGATFFGYGGGEVTTEVELRAGAAHHLELRYRQQAGAAVAGVSLRAAPPLPADARRRAADAAAAADVAVVVVGTTPEWETEGADRPSLALPGDQAQLVRAVCAAQPATVVVVNAGAPVLVDWAAAAGAVVQWWLPGQEGPEALVDLLLGATDPTGRLPVTFPMRLEDTGPHAHGPSAYPGVDGRVRYAEGLLAGYRHLDHRAIEPAFAFGHGLAYTTFAYGAPRVEVDADGVTVHVAVTNTGARAGTEVVQVYARGGGRPGVVAPQELVGFAPVRLGAGASAEVALAVDPRAWTWWSAARGGWAPVEGTVQLVVASSSRDPRGHVDLDAATCPPRR